MNSSRLSSATVLPALICLFYPGESVAAEALTVRGSVSLDPNGVPQIKECGTNRVVSLETMAPDGYAKFNQRYADLSQGGKFAVLVNVSGNRSKKRGSRNELSFDSPAVQRYQFGACKSTPRMANDPLALTRLLGQLREKLDRLHATPGSQSSFHDESELAVLVGATKKEIRKALGAPNSCNVYKNHQPNCPKSDEWSYHFFYVQPLTLGGGCCGLELQFDKNSKVIVAQWQGYS